MFSPTIQAYIDQGGKDAAMQRVQSIRAHVANIEKQLNPESVKAEQKTFCRNIKGKPKRRRAVSYGKQKLPFSYIRCKCT